MGIAAADINGVCQMLKMTATSISILLHYRAESFSWESRQHMTSLYNSTKRDTCIMILRILGVFHQSFISWSRKWMNRVFGILCIIYRSIPPMKMPYNHSYRKKTQLLNIQIFNSRHFRSLQFVFVLHCVECYIHSTLRNHTRLLHCNRNSVRDVSKYIHIFHTRSQF